MKAIEIFEKHYPERTEKIREKFPAFLETAREVEVVPWQKEFQVADKNPEAIDEIEFWNTLLDSGMITREEWERETNRIMREVGYTSKTVGIAFIKEKQVSFRHEVPPFNVLVHEVGHVHFQEVDTFWSATYGGGEILFHLALHDRYKITEENIRRFHSLYHLAVENPKAFADLVVEKIAPYFGDQIVPAFYPICLFSGWLPFGVSSAEVDTFDLRNPKWLEMEPDRTDTAGFIQNLTAGLQYNDTFWIVYSQKLGIIE